MENQIKNNLKSKQTEEWEEAPYYLEVADFSEAQGFKSDLMERSKIHFLFCLDEEVIFEFGPVYTRKLSAGKAFIMYNPDQDLPLRLRPGTHSRMAWLHVHFDDLHSLFAPGIQDAPVFKLENASRKIYEEKEISPELLLVLNQLFQQHMPAHVQKLFMQGKFFEILSLFFSVKSPNVENCPFLNDETTIRKLKAAKEILLSQYQDPPTIPELARQVELNELQLKVGFKEIYGNTPYQFLLDYKLDLAKQFLISQKLQVNEVADKIGYTNVSHFIEAFKRKFGVTPKKLSKN